MVLPPSGDCRIIYTSAYNGAAHPITEMPLRLGIDAYSLNWQGWTAVETLEYAARMGVDNVQFSERGFLDSLDVGYLHDLRARHARQPLPEHGAIVPRERAERKRERDDEQQSKPTHPSPRP